jgi:hypothetical protein
MHENLSLTRTGLNVALAYTLPVLAWLLGQSLLVATGQSDPGRSLHLLFTSLLLLQAGALSVSLPWLLRSSSRPGHICAVAMLLLVPLPLYAIVWLAGAVPAAVLGLALLCLSGFAVLLYVWFALCLAWTRAGQLRALVLLGTQVVTLGCCWHFRVGWQQVLGL